MSSGAGLGKNLLSSSLWFVAAFGAWQAAEQRASVSSWMPLQAVLCPLPSDPPHSEARDEAACFSSKSAAKELGKNGLTILCCESMCAWSHASILVAVFKQVTCIPSSWLCSLLRSKSQFLFLGRGMTQGSQPQDVGIHRVALVCLPYFLGSLAQ